MATSKSIKATSRNIKAVVPAIKAEPMTSDEALGHAERTIGTYYKMAREALAENSARVAKSFAEVDKYLADFCPDADIADNMALTAARVAGQTYWGMDDAAQAAGRVRVYAETSKALGRIKAETTDACEILRRLRDFAVENCVNDRYRSERSTNAYSNANAANDGEGRGDAHQKVIQILDAYLPHAEEYKAIEASVAKVMTPEVVAEMMARISPANDDRVGLVPLSVRDSV